MKQRVHEAFEYCVVFKKPPTPFAGPNYPSGRAWQGRVFAFFAIAAAERISEKSAAFRPKSIITE
jgi:hypothetical protein